MQKEVQNGHRQLCGPHRHEALLTVKNTLWDSHIDLLCLSLPLRIASHGERMVYAGWRSEIPLRNKRKALRAWILVDSYGKRMAF